MPSCVPGHCLFIKAGDSLQYADASTDSGVCSSAEGLTLRPALVVSLSPRRLMLRPAPWAARGPTTQVKSAEVVSLSWRVLLSCRPAPTRGCQVRPRPADVCSDSWRVLCRDANVFRPAHLPAAETTRMTRAKLLTATMLVVGLSPPTHMAELYYATC